MAEATLPLPYFIHSQSEIPSGSNSSRSHRRSHDVPAAEAHDMLLAAGEVFANAGRHGGGATSLRVGRVGIHFVCEIADAGSGLDDPLVGYVPPRAAQACGVGLWVARQTTSALELLHPDGGGLTVRLWT